MPKKAKPPLTPIQRSTMANVFEHVPRWRVAARLGVDVCTLSRWIAGKGSPGNFVALVAAMQEAARDQSKAANRAIANFLEASSAKDTTPPAP